MPAELIQPQPFLGRFRSGRAIRREVAGLYRQVSSSFRCDCDSKLAERPSVVHICDHSNAVYARRCRDVPVVVTCHDLLAVRGALGEETDCPASVTGKVLAAMDPARVCNKPTPSPAFRTRPLTDAERLLRHDGTKTQPERDRVGPELSVSTNSADEARTRLASALECLDLIEAIRSSCRIEFETEESRRRSPYLCPRPRTQWNGQLGFRRRTADAGIALVRPGIG